VVRIIQFRLLLFLCFPPSLAAQRSQTLPLGCCRRRARHLRMEEIIVERKTQKIEIIFLCKFPCSHFCYGRFSPPMGSATVGWCCSLDGWMDCHHWSLQMGENFLKMIKLLQVIIKYKMPYSSLRPSLPSWQGHRRLLLQLFSVAWKNGAFTCGWGYRCMYKIWLYI
jgi:hypothetical protein